MISPYRLVALSTFVMLAAAFPVTAEQQHPVGLAVRANTKRAIAASAFATIQGNAFNAINGALPNSMIRVRDVRYGRIVGSSLTNSEGAYTFKGLDPGNYIVELVSVDQTPLAATNLINANAGEIVNTIVKLPFRPARLANLLGGQGSTATGGAKGLIPQLKDQLPESALQGVAAVVTTGPPISER
jgi:hypothetical protein